GGTMAPDMPRRGDVRRGPLAMGHEPPSTRCRLRACISAQSGTFLNTSRSLLLDAKRPSGIAGPIGVATRSCLVIVQCRDANPRVTSGPTSQKRGFLPILRSDRSVILLYHQSWSATRVSHTERVPMLAEHLRLEEARQEKAAWKKWGPYLSE